MFTVRELCGLALLASLFFGAANLVYLSTGLRPRVIAAGQSERASAALAVLPFYLGISVMVGSGAGWLIAFATGRTASTATAWVVSLVVALAVAAALARHAMAVLPRNAERAATNRAARKATTEG